MATIAQTHNEESEQGFGLAPRLLLASLSLAAGGVHLAMAPIHASSSVAQAGGFAVVGWAQILLAIVLLVRPTRIALFTAIGLNTAVIITYIISRTVGLPVGGHPGQAESVELIDLMTTVFEAMIVVGAAVLLARPAFGATRTTGQGWSFESIAMVSAAPLLVLVATTVTLTDPQVAGTTSGGHDSGSASVSATGGGSDGHGGATQTAAQAVALAGGRCDLAFNPASYWREATLASVDTISGGEGSTAGHNASAVVNGSAELDRIITTQVTGKGELGDARMVVALSEVSNDVYDNWLRWTGAAGASSHGAAPTPTSGSAAPANGMGGHIGPQAWHAMTDKSQCAALEAELALARDTAMKYPTVSDAEEAGWVQITPYVPGIAAHFMNFGLVDGTFDITKPEMLLYDGTDDDSSIVGLSYYIKQEGNVEPTQGFTGNNDRYHRHLGLCVSGAGVIGDSTTTEEECAARGGSKADGTGGWMSHAWVVPGCESPWGVFSGVSPLLDMPLTRASGGDGGGCAGSSVRGRYDFNAGDIENTPTQVGGSVELAIGN